jgi:DEAD/DEAH box helicase domain-containing protein
MLPLQQAYEVQHSILEYLKATFSFKDKAVHEAFYKFVTDAEDGIIKGPYYSQKLILEMKTKCRLNWNYISRRN